MVDKSNIIKKRFDEAFAFFKNGKLNLASAICQEILELSPNEAHTLQLLGLIAIAENHSQEAICYLKRALASLPDHPICHHNLASAYNMAGNFKEAQQHYQQAITANPDYIEAYFNFSFVADLSQHKDFIQPILKQLESPELSDSNRSLLHFAAGKYYHEHQNYKEAFSHFQKSHDPAVAVAIEKYQQLAEFISNKYNQEFIAPFKAASNNSRQPLFIVGMPTSGETLLDNLLAQHPEITSIKTNHAFLIIAETLAYMDPKKPFYANYIEHLTKQHVKKIAEMYLTQLKKRGDNTYVINSLAINFLHLGLIKLIFPHARIIHIRRDPLDACLACYFTRLQPHNEFSHSLTHIGQFYQVYNKMMSFYQTQFANDMLTVSLESLLKNPETTLKTVLDFLNLPWDPECIDYNIIKGSCHYAPGFSHHYPSATKILNDSMARA